MSKFLKTTSELAIVISFGAMLAGCEGSSSYRVASVGDGTASSSGGAGSSGGGDGSSGGGASSSGGGASSGGSSGGGFSSGGASSSGGSGPGGGGQTGTGGLIGNVLVTAGNVVLGVANKTNGVAGTTTALAPVTAPVTGKVVRILAGTGQSLIDIGNGRTILVGGTNNAIGRVVSIGVAGRTLVGVPAGNRWSASIC